MKRGHITVTHTAIQFDGTSETWEAITAQDWDDCAPCWEPGRKYPGIWRHYAREVVRPGDWVARDENGVLYVADADAVVVA